MISRPVGVGRLLWVMVRVAMAAEVGMREEEKEEEEVEGEEQEQEVVVGGGAGGLYWVSGGSVFSRRQQRPWCQWR